MSRLSIFTLYSCPLQCNLPLCILKLSFITDVYWQDEHLWHFFLLWLCWWQLNFDCCMNLFLHLLYRHKLQYNLSMCLLNLVFIAGWTFVKFIHLCLCWWQISFSCCSFTCCTCIGDSLVFVALWNYFHSCCICKNACYNVTL